MRIKPGRWGLSPGLVDPKWRWIWQQKFFLMPFWEGGGLPRAYPVIEPFTLTVNGGPDWYPAETGTSQQFIATSGDAYHTTTLPPWFPGRSSRPFTCLVMVTPYDLSRAHNILHYGTSDNSALSSYMVYIIQTTGLVEASLGGVSLSGGAVAVNQPSVIGSRWDGSKAWILRNGNIEDETSVGSIFTNASQALNIATRSLGGGGSSRSLNGIIHIIWVFDAALTDMQVRQLSFDPFGPLRMMDEAGVIYPAAGGGDLTLTLATLTLAGSVQDLSATPGAVSLALDSLTLAGSVQSLSLTTVTAITLDTLALAGAAQALTVAVGGVSITLDALALTGSVEALTISTGAVSIMLDTLTLMGNAEVLSLLAGAVTITLDTLSLTGSVEDLAIALGALSILLDTLSLAATVQALTIVPGAVSITLDTLSLAGSVEDLSLMTYTLILMNTLSLVVSAEDLALLPGGVIVNLDTLTLAGSVEDLNVSIGGAVLQVLFRGMYKGMYKRMR